MSKQRYCWVRHMVRRARIASLQDEVAMVRHVLHGILSLAIKRTLADWEAAGLGRDESLSILRETYNDLAPKEEQWGTGPKPPAPPSLRPGESPPGVTTHASLEAAINAALARRDKGSPPPAPASELPPNPTLPPPPPGQGPGYPLTNLPTLAELQAQIDKRRAAGER